MNVKSLRRCQLWPMMGKENHAINQSKKMFACKRYSTGSKEAGGFRNYLKSLKWFSIPASVGFAYIGYLQFRHIQEREKRHIRERQSGHIEQSASNSAVLEDWQIEGLKLLPTRVLSRWWGYLSHLRIPIWMRKPVLGAYVKMYDCEMDEAIISDLAQFPTFSEFFKRKLLPEARTIDKDSDMVSPVDGKVLYLGEVDSSYNMEQVKGVTYSLVSFLGPKHPFVKELIKNKKRQANSTQITERAQRDDAEPTEEKNNSDLIADDNSNNDNILTSQDGIKRSDKLYYCILYLAPGDYHWFHSPTDWTIEHRRHIPGHLFSVNPYVMRKVPGLFNFNERVILHGHWKHGPLLMAAVGAYNVGSVHLEFAVEKNLKTNIGKLEPNYFDRLYGAAGFAFKAGESVGGFDLGSSIVLVFNGPENLHFQVQPGQKVKLGEALAKAG